MAEEKIEVPKHKWYQFIDTLTRLDELLEALLKVQQQTLEVLKGLRPPTVAVAVPPVAPPIPPEVIPFPPAPPELEPITTRLDGIMSQLISLNRKTDDIIDLLKLAIKVIPKPLGSIRKFGKIVTSDTFKTVAEYTPERGKRFHLTKIVVSCPEDVEAQVFWMNKPLTVIYNIMGKIPFTDWYPWDYRTHPELKEIIGDGASKIELKVRYPSGGVAAECYGEIVGEET